MGFILVVSDKNQTLFHLRISITLLHLKHCSSKLQFRPGLIRAAWMYEYLTSLCISPTLKRSLMLQRLKCSNTIEIPNRIMFNFYPALPQLVDYHQTMVSVVVPKPSSIDVRVCVLLYCFSSSSFLQRDNQYHPYPLSQVRHISYQLIKAVKCKELSVVCLFNLTMGMGG